MLKVTPPGVEFAGPVVGTALLLVDAVALPTDARTTVGWPKRVTRLPQRRVPLRAMRADALRSGAG
jgi:hypothetical protein